MKIGYKTYLAMIILGVLAFSLIQAPQVHATETSVNTKLNAFLTNVLRIDLIKYTVVTQQGYSDTYPAKYGGQVEEETLSYILTTADNSSRLNVNSIIDRGVLISCTCRPIHGSLLYVQPPSTDIINQGSRIMNDYRSFVSQNYAMDTSYLQLAQTMLSNVTNLTSSIAVSGNLQLETSQYSERISPVTNANETITTLHWIYTQNGEVASSKHIFLDFVDGQLDSFVDTYGLFRIGPQASITNAEAVKLGFASAQNFDVPLFQYDANGNPTSVKPDWSNATYDISLAMLPGDFWMTQPSLPIQLPNSSLIPQTVYPSNITRDALTLYPVWQLTFYFSKPIGNTLGIQVGVYGDTGQIHYRTYYSILGTQQPVSGSQALSPPTSLNKHSSPPPVGTKSQNSASLFTLPAYSYAVIIALLVMLAIGIYITRRRGK